MASLTNITEFYEVAGTSFEMAEVNGHSQGIEIATGGAEPKSP